jgi:death-on-curing protein
MGPVFLRLDEVLALHSEQIEFYGGSPGVRDMNLLLSALATPAATFGDAFLHSTVHEMAAACLFHLSANHPFVDGNKRVGLIAVIAFLALNDLVLTAAPPELEDLVMRVADGEATKADVAVFLQKHTGSGPPDHGD